MHSRSFRACLVLLAAFFATPALAQVDVPTGATFALGGDSLDLGNTSLQVGGSFAVGSGSAQNIDSVSILSGGTLDGGSGSLTLFGDWSNAGTFTAGSGTVNFVDGGIAQSNIGGNSTFASTSFVSATGKNYIFAVGTTQSVSGLLTILGTSTQGIQFRSSTAGQVANIDLLAGGSQNIDFVGVSDVHATGQPLAPTKTNDGGTGNATGWFGAAVGANTAPTPALSDIALLLLALLIAVFATFAFPTSRQQG
ncbi:MAG: hypothetical protein ACYC9P_11605 [Rudaea sp.]